MEEQELTELRSKDWDEISTKVLQAALVYAARYGWDKNSSLPKGGSVEDLVIQTICDIWQSPERLRKDVQLTTQLKGIIRHKLWNHSRYSDEDIERRDDLGEVAIDADSAPESSVDDSDEFDRVIELLSDHGKIKGKPEMEDVLLAISCGASDAESIATDTGLEISRVYQLQRELRQIYPEIASHMQSRDGVL